MGRIIGLCNQKGGTGKTTSAVNISSYIALSKRKTLLLDLDPQGNATSGIGFDSTNKKTSYEILMREASIEEAIYSSAWENLFIIPATVALTGVEVELINCENRELRLKQEIDKIKDDFDYIIIDAPPSLGLLTVNVLSVISSLIIPVQCEYYALEGVSQLLHTVELMKERLNPELYIEGALLTMADFRTRLTLQVIEEIKKYFSENTFNTIIPRNIKLAEAPSFGKPIYFYDSSCVGAKAYQSLVEEIIKEKIELEIDQNKISSIPEENIAK